MKEIKLKIDYKTQTRVNKTTREDVYLGGRSVQVRDGQVDKALRKLKKKVNNSGVLLEVRRKEAYEKPTTTRKLARNAAKKRWQKYLSQQKLPNKFY